MIFSFNLYEFYRLTEDFKCIEELNTLTDRHIGIYGAVEK